MLDWFVEDYGDFVKKCNKNVSDIKINIQTDIINNTPAADRDWSAVILRLADNQLIIAKFMADHVGVGD